jgi:Holliday junction resolvase RusA-like endonuclease
MSAMSKNAIMVLLISCESTFRIAISDQKIDTAPKLSRRFRIKFISLLSSTLERSHVMISSPYQVASEPFFYAQLTALPSSVNRAYMPGGNTIIATPELRQFKIAAAWELKNAKIDRGVLELLRAAKKKKCHVPLAANIAFCYRTLWKIDLDAGIKHLLDAVFEHLEINDNQNVDMHVFKIADPERPRVEIELRRVTEIEYVGR